MIELDNDNLEVQLLDPDADRQRFGVRYCTGGYIFQVRDHVHGDLMSGPTYPDDFNWFDGQGIPDAFNLGPLVSKQVPNDALVIGVGVCDLRERRVRSFCHWTIDRNAPTVSFRTEQAFEDWALSLTREVTLSGRTVRSRTVLKNVGAAPVPVRWFPHPFFPQPRSSELLWINAPLRWQDVDGYTRLPNGFIARAGWPWREDYYHPLDHDASAPLVLLQRHPLLGTVAAACSYVPGFFPIWGNGVTFSWEPFLERTVACGQSLDWWIDYIF